MSAPMPEITDVNRRYWEGLSEGELRYQHCEECGNDWLPAREHCPACLSARSSWNAASGRGHVVSWIVYHTAYAPHLEDRLPYDVTIVELEEGPRLLTNIVDGEAGARLAPGLAVELAITAEGDLQLPRFRIAQNTSQAEAVSREG